jgi:hypothetical protein
MKTVQKARPRVSKPRKVGYRGSGTLAMCGRGPHPGGQLFHHLCTLADSFLACKDDPAAARIGSILSLLALYSTKQGDRDFRYPFGSFVMDLALVDEARDRAASPGMDTVPYGQPLLAR